MTETLPKLGSPNPNPCRLCDGNVALIFSGLVLRKHTVGYWRCASCGSVQTDLPYWLDQAYATVSSATDTGIVARTLQMAELASLLLRILAIGPKSPCLDWGGGNGLFCRMMRDQGFNFLNYDKYATPFYSSGFTAPRSATTKCAAVTTFEVFEHLADPKRSLSEILRFEPIVWVFSTQLYEGQNQGWKYFGPENGRHVFFYSEKALRDFAEVHDYHFLRGRHIHMFLRKTEGGAGIGAFKRSLVQSCIRGGKSAVLAAAVNFRARQRRAHLFWQSDSEFIRQTNDSTHLSANAG